MFKKIGSMGRESHFLPTIKQNVNNNAFHYFTVVLFSCFNVYPNIDKQPVMRRQDTYLLQTFLQL